MSNEFFQTENGRIVYLNALAIREKGAPWSGRTASGYGSEIPCAFLAQTETNGPFRRVYCRIFSNAGTCYVVKRGKRYVVNVG